MVCMTACTIPLTDLWSFFQAENCSASIISDSEISRDIDGDRMVRFTIISNA